MHELSGETYVDYVHIWQGDHHPAPYSFDWLQRMDKMVVLLMVRVVHQLYHLWQAHVEVHP
jgi:hypothetical protein